MRYPEVPMLKLMPRRCLNQIRGSSAVDGPFSLPRERGKVAHRRLRRSAVGLETQRHPVDAHSMPADHGRFARAYRLDRPRIGRIGKVEEQGAPVLSKQAEEHRPAQATAP